MPEEPETESLAARREAEIMDTTPHEHHMLPVWFFIGVILFIYGVMLFVNGIRELSNPPGTVLQELHAPIWWGAIMAVVGVIFTYTNRPGTQG
ncbi:MAG TPA: hypothetical protein VKM93_12340 [Terriglobia bacterium]|nr:hypothetical protein [Terriglobia bacterium]